MPRWPSPWASVILTGPLASWPRLCSMPPPVRVAAALALARNQVAWPDGAVAAVITAADDGAGIEGPWCRQGDWADELMVVADDTLAAALLAQMVTAARAKTRRADVWAMTRRGQARHSAPGLLLPVVRPLLDDPDPGVRRVAVWALRQSGTASGQFAGEIAAIAAQYPRTAGQGGFTPEYHAVQTLMRLDDPRWLGPFCGCRRRSCRQGTAAASSAPAVEPADARAVRQHLGAHDGAQPAVPLLAMVLGQWGPAAVGAAPELLALLPDAGGTAARALLQIGCQDPNMVPGLRALADKGGDVEAAMGVS